MTDTAARFALICALSACHFACSAGSPSSSSNDTAGGSHGGGSGGIAQGGTSAAGSSGSTSSSGGAGAGGLASSAGAAGSNTLGGTNAGGAGGASGAGGSPGASGSGGSGGSAAVTCTPGTGTQPVGTSSELDQKTCLTWTKTRSATTMTNKQAFTYCDQLTQDGISDWRVPAPEELDTWSGLTTDSTAYITGPIYIPTASTVMDGCTGDSHSCNLAKYNDNSVTCAWQGVGFAGWVACVSGTATAGSTPAAYSAANCSPCNSELSSFKVQDCSAYAN